MIDDKLCILCIKIQPLLLVMYFIYTNGQLCRVISLPTLVTWPYLKCNLSTNIFFLRKNTLRAFFLKFHFKLTKFDFNYIDFISKIQRNKDAAYLRTPEMRTRAKIILHPSTVEVRHIEFVVRQMSQTHVQGRTRAKVGGQY